MGEIKEENKVPTLKIFSEEKAKQMAIWPGKYHMLMSMESETDYEMFYRYYCLCQEVVLKSWAYISAISEKEPNAEDLQKKLDELYETVIVTIKISPDVPDVKHIK